MAEGEAAVPIDHGCARFIRYDVSQWPLVRAVVQPGVTPDDPTFDAHLACFHRLLSLDKPFYIEFDVRQAEGASFDQLRRQAAQRRELKPLIRRNLVCSTVVVDSYALKMLLDFLFAIQTPTKPNKAFRTPHDAEAWMREQWDKAMPAKFFFE